ncbi:MAG: sugar ABC transporter permease [Bifidobacteriaceae bacterium]|nr:sugar ABC transporter permease [Bifidobacteriaceae bacterium]
MAASITRKRRGRFRRYGPPLLLISPSVILIGIFVYGLIGSAFQTSMTSAHSAAEFTGKQPTEFVFLGNYTAWLATKEAHHALLNQLIFTAVFLGGTLSLGFLWAWLLDKRAKAEGIFRSVYLFPMAVSAVAAGVVWKWLLNPNRDAKAYGLNRLFQTLGLDFMQNSWWTKNLTWGIAAIAMPAIWQMAGYVMALFLAGFRGIPNELREAARVDGANEWKLYRHVIFPQLSPVALSAIIIIGHMSLKTFDLIMSISKHTNYQTKIPAIEMYRYMAEGDYANAAMVGVVLLLIVLVLIIPYLIHTTRAEKNR